MAGLNEAWRVLRDPTRRAAYDASLGLDRPDQHVGRAPGGSPLAATAWPGEAATLRWWSPSLWMVALAVVAIIFVVTAYAGAKTSTVTRVTVAGMCLSQQPGVDAIVPCASAHTALIVTQVGNERDCPNSTSPHKLLGREVLVCVDTRR